MSADYGYESRDTSVNDSVALPLQSTLRKGVAGVLVVRNAVRLGYPLYYTVRSVINACDEFVLSEGFSEDSTMDIVKQLQKEYPEKIRVFHDIWKPSRRGETIAHVTNNAIKMCRYEWIYCLQADEFVHENNLSFIASVPKRFSHYHSVSFKFTHFFPTLLFEAEVGAGPIRIVRNYSKPLRRTIRIAWQKTKIKIAVRRWLKPIEPAFTPFMDTFSAGDGWSFEGNIYPMLQANFAKPIFHVGSVERSGNPLAAKLESHSKSLYTAMPWYTQMAELARIGKLEKVSRERGLKIRPYESRDYPRLLREWAEAEGIECAV